MNTTTATNIRGNIYLGRLLTIGVFLSVLLLVGCISISADGETGEGATEENQRHSFTVGENPTIDVDGFNGSIEIVVGQDGVVEVDSKLTFPNRVAYSATTSGNTVTVVAKRVGAGFHFGRSPGAKIQLVVPAHAVIKAHTSNGPITITGVIGSGDLDTSNGKITITDVDGNFDSSTSNGSVEMSNVSGQYNAESSNGKIRFSGSFTAGSDNRFKTSNGSIDVMFQGDPNVELDASTSNGTVESGRSILAVTTEKKHLAGKYGDGSASLILRTSNGSIDIR